MCPVRTRNQTPVDFVATHPDNCCPSERGPIPDIGGMMKFLEITNGMKPSHVFGKPSPTLLAPVLAKFKPEEIAVVGDRLYTDIALGAEAGIATALVLSGETSAADAAADVAADVAEAPADSADDAADAASDIASKAGDALSDAADSAKKAAAKAADALSAGMDAVQEAASDAADAIGESAGKAKDAVMKALDKGSDTAEAAAEAAAE